VKNRHCNLISYILAAGVLLLGIFIAFFIYQETAPKDYVVITSPLFDKESRDEGRTWFQKEENGESITLDTVQDFLETGEYLLVQGGIGTWIIHLYDRTDTLYNPALTDEEIRGINQGIADRDRHHLSAIERLHSVGMLSSLPEDLRETAEMRRMHPEVSMAELAALCHISKSGMSHRLRKIRAMAEEVSI